MAEQWERTQRRRSATASHLLTERVPTVRLETTIGALERVLLQQTAAFHSIDYVYVLDADRKLVGVISIKDIFRQPKDATVGRAMVTALVTARPHTSQERIAHLALKHNIKAIPVVDQAGMFLGAVPNDTILKVLYQETSEDLLRLAGIKKAETTYDNVLSVPLATSLKHRLPWLVVGMFGGLLIATIIGQFEATLGKNLVLAAFIPLVVYLASAVGTQMEAFIIRDLALNPNFRFSPYLLRQLNVIALIGLITGGLLFSLTALWYNDLRLGLVLGVSLIITILSSVVTGLLVPYTFSKLRMDPANASGPVATIIQDALSVVIYFTIASWLL